MWKREWRKVLRGSRAWHSGENRRSELVKPRLLGRFQCRYAALRGELLKLQRVVAGNDAIDGPGKLNHAFLVFDVRGVIRIAERGAGQVCFQIAVEIGIVGSQNKTRCAFD